MEKLETITFIRSEYLKFRNHVEMYESSQHPHPYPMPISEGLADPLLKIERDLAELKSNHERIFCDVLSDTRNIAYAIKRKLDEPVMVKVEDIRDGSDMTPNSIKRNS